MAAPTPVPSTRPRPSYGGISAVAVALVLLVVSVVLYLGAKAAPGNHFVLLSGAAFVGFLVLLGVGISLLRRPKSGRSPSAPRAAPGGGDATAPSPDVDVLVSSPPPVTVSDYAAQSPRPPAASSPPPQDTAIGQEAENRDAARRERRACPQCGTPNPIDFEVCERCGARLSRP